MHVSAEGRVEHQKLNPPQAVLPPGWVFGVQLDYSCRLKSVSATLEKRVMIMITMLNLTMRTKVKKCKLPKKVLKLYNANLCFTPYNVFAVRWSTSPVEHQSVGKFSFYQETIWGNFFADFRRNLCCWVCTRDNWQRTFSYGNIGLLMSNCKIALQMSRN